MLFCRHIKICRNLCTFWKSLAKNIVFFHGQKCTIAWYILHIELILIHILGESISAQTWSHFVLFACLTRFKAMKDILQNSCWLSGSELALHILMFKIIWFNLFSKKALTYLFMMILLLYVSFCIRQFIT